MTNRQIPLADDGDHVAVVAPAAVLRPAQRRHGVRWAEPQDHRSRAVADPLPALLLRLRLEHACLLRLVGRRAIEHEELHRLRPRRHAEILQNVSRDSSREDADVAAGPELALEHVRDRVAHALEQALDLLDLTLDQAHRPDKGIYIEPVYFAVSTEWLRATPPSSRLMLDPEAMFSMTGEHDSGHRVSLHYQRIEDATFRASRDWNIPRHHPLVRKAKEVARVR